MGGRERWYKEPERQTGRAIGAGILGTEQGASCPREKRQAGDEEEVGWTY